MASVTAVGAQLEREVGTHSAIARLLSRPCKTAATRMNPRFFTDGGAPDPSEIVIGSIDF